VPEQAHSFCFHVSFGEEFELGLKVPESFLQRADEVIE
jgi:hypothetical protein